MQKQDIKSVQDIDEFLREAGTFLVSLCRKMLDKSPLESILVHSASIFDPKVMIISTVEQSEKHFRRLLNHFINLKIITVVFADKALRQLGEIFYNDLKHDHDKFAGFNRKDIA